MPLPILVPAAKAQWRDTVLNRTQAAARLGINGAGLDKLIRSGILPLPLQVSGVAKLTGRERLKVAAGELTVLRVDARVEADRRKHPRDLRRWAGFHVDHSDGELEESSLRWWRADAERVVGNELLAVTVSSFPVAVYKITERLVSEQRPGEAWERHRFGGELVARVVHGMTVRYNDAASPEEIELAEQIMASRIVVDSGGPIGYLEADADVGSTFEPRAGDSAPRDPASGPQDEFGHLNSLVDDLDGQVEDLHHSLSHQRRGRR